MSRPRGYDPDHVLDAAMSTFWDRGYAATSAQDLVDSTGLGRGSIYNAFDSKHGLFEASLRHYDDQRTSRLVGILEEGEGPARERLREVLASVVEEETAEHPEHRGCLVVNSAMELAGLDPAVTELVRRTFARMERAFGECVRQGQDEGTIAKDRDPRDLACYLLNSMYGLRVLGKVSDHRTLVDVIDRTLRSL